MRTMMILAKLAAIAALLALLAAPACADTGRASVSVADVRVSPAALMPGDSGTVTITLVNTPRTLTGTSTTTSDTYNYGPGVSNSLATPSHSSTTSQVSSSVPDGSYIVERVTLRPDGPIQVTSGEFLDVGRMGMGDTAKLAFDVRADPAAADGAYRLTLEVRTDDDGIYLNYPVTVQVDGDEPRLIVSGYAEAYNTTENGVSLDVVNPRATPIDSVAVRASGDEFVFEPQEFYIGTLKAGEMYTADFEVDSRGEAYAASPEFVLVYRNGDNWHATDPVLVDAHAPRRTWWDAWWPALALGAAGLALAAGVAVVLARRSHGKSN